MSFRSRKSSATHGSMKCLTGVNILFRREAISEEVTVANLIRVLMVAVGGNRDFILG